MSMMIKLVSIGLTVVLFSFSVAQAQGLKHGCPAKCVKWAPGSPGTLTGKCIRWVQPVTCPHQNLH